MRTLTVFRKKKFAACLGTMKVYLSDPAGDTEIQGIRCRKLGDLKNGKSASFAIGPEEGRVFVIADRMTKSYCADSVAIPAGEESITLSGENKVNPFLGNPFRFDQKPDAFALAARKSKNKWGVFIFVPLFLLFQLYCYFRQVNTMVKRDSEVHGKEISVETIVTNEYIQNTASTGAVNKLEYDKIRSAVKTKNLILLRSKANLIYIFRKDTFSKGTKDEFIAFLASKGIKVK